MRRRVVARQDEAWAGKVIGTTVTASAKRSARRQAVNKWRLPAGGPVAANVVALWYRE